MANNPIDAVNKLNNYFASIGKRLASSIRFNDISEQFMLFMISQRAPNSMFIYSTNDSEIKSIINGLKNHCAVGWDRIASSILKATVDILTPSIT